MAKQFGGNPDSCSVKNVWLLNLIPYAGLGLFYGAGPRSIPFLLGLWFFELATGAQHFSQQVFLYFLLSIIGTVALLHRQGKFDSMNSQSISTFRAEHNLPDDDNDDQDRLRQWLINSSPNQQHTNQGTAHDTDRDAIETPYTKIETVGNKIDHLKVGHAGESSEFALSTMEQKAKKAERVLKQMGTDDGDSKYASDLFEHKVSAAEKQMKAKAEAEAEAAPGANAGLQPPSTNPAASPAPNAVLPASSSLQSNRSDVFNADDDARKIQLGFSADAATAGASPATLDFSPQAETANASSPSSSDFNWTVFPTSPASLDVAMRELDQKNSSAAQVDPFAKDAAADTTDLFAKEAEPATPDPFAKDAEPAATRDPFADEATDVDIFADQSSKDDASATMDDKTDPFARDAFGEKGTADKTDPFPDAKKADPFAPDAFVVSVAPTGKTDPFPSDVDEVASSAAPDQADPFSVAADPFADNSKSPAAQGSATTPSQPAQIATKSSSKESSPPVVQTKVQESSPPIVPHKVQEPSPTTTETPSTSADIFANPFGSYDPYGSSPSSFVLPSFNFSFDSSASATTPAAAASTGEKVICPGCGKDKDPNFSFCLTCGHNFT